MKLLNEFAVFSEVVEAGSFTAAAGPLGLSKAAVSEHVSRLEAQLGVQLLQRTTRRLSVTEAGEACYRHTRRMRAEADAAAQAAAEYHAEPMGVLRVACPEAFSVRHIVPFAARFLPLYPRLSLNLSEAPVHVDLIGERFDMAIRIGELPDSRLVVRRLGLARSLLVAAPVFLQQGEGFDKPSDLERAASLRFLPLQGTDGLRIFGPDGQAETVRMPVRLAADSGSAVAAAARAGIGIAMLPDWAVAGDLAAGTLVEVLPGWGGVPVPIQAVYPSQARLSPKVRAFVDAFAEAFRG